MIGTWAYGINLSPSRGIHRGSRAGRSGMRCMIAETTRQAKPMAQGFSDMPIPIPMRMGFGAKSSVER